MGARGRQSGADLAVVSSGELSTMVGRPEPMPELTQEQAEEWRSVVNRLPADWFPRETWAMLAQYCRHVVSANRIAQMIRTIEVGPQYAGDNVVSLKGDDEDDEGFCLKDYDKLLAMQEREGRAMSSLATRMRLTQQATYHPEKNKGKGGMKKPWEMAK